MVQRIAVTDHILHLSTARQNPTGQENNTGMTPEYTTDSCGHPKGVPKNTPFFAALFFTA